MLRSSFWSWTRCLISILLLLSFSDPSSAASPKPYLKISRPAGNDPTLHILVLKDFGRIQIPYAGARITIQGPEGLSYLITADLLGEVRINPAEILKDLNAIPEKLTLQATVKIQDQGASDTITLSQEEMAFYSKQAAEVLINEGNQMAKEGRLKDALKKYQKAFYFDPASQRVAYNLALAHEKLGMPHLAVSWYSTYLLNQTSEAQDRQMVKKKVIQIVTKLNPKPPLPKKVVRLMEQARKAVAARDYLKAILIYELIQAIVPWWPEPYYSEALVFEHLAYQNSFSGYAPSVVQNFEIFLAAASPKDSRLGDVKARIEEIKKIEEGLKAPPMIPIK